MAAMATAAVMAKAVNDVPMHPCQLRAKANLHGAAATLNSGRRANTERGADKKSMGGCCHQPRHAHSKGISMMHSRASAAKLLDFRENSTFAGSVLFECFVAASSARYAF